jgi:DNA-binding LacI/PurR family transcriptional regulator
VVGFDDIELARYSNPPLTTIAQDKTEIGAQAVRRLVERIGQKDTPYQRAVLPTRLVARESTAPA